jgi:uncharacterized protein
MNLDVAIRCMELAASDLPREAMQWALDNWDEAGPCFVELLERCACGADRSQSTRNALFFVVHLLGERRESRAFPGLCRLLEDRELSESVLSEAVTETLNKILISTYDGDPDPLKRVIESRTSDEWARGAAIEAIAYLARTGVFTEEWTHSYMLHLYATMQPRTGSFIWTAWAMSAANLGYGDCAEKVEQLIGSGGIRDYDMAMEDFYEQLNRTVADPKRMAGFEYDRVRPFSDAVGTLSKWYCFSEHYRHDQERWLAGSRQDVSPTEDKPFWLRSTELESTLDYDEFDPELADADPISPDDGKPIYNPLRHLGRNDPCFCGSGKKYKKCCLQ